MTTPTGETGNSQNRIPSCTILYSTQTKRAKACARRTARILREQTCLELLGGTSFDELATTSFVELASAEKYKQDRQHFFLFFVSTTGDGEHCDTIQQTWKSLLKKSLPRNVFEGNQFALFALGDRAYGPQFCAAGRKLAVRLMQLGMKTKCEVGYGDDNTPNGGAFNDLDDWIRDQLLASLQDSIQQQPPKTPSSSKLDTSRYKVTSSEKVTTTTTEEEWQQETFKPYYQDFFARQGPITCYNYTGIHRMAGTDPAGASNFPLVGQVETNDRLTASDWEQNTRHIQLRVKKDRVDDSDGNMASTVPTLLPYCAGDVATVMPSNEPAEVQAFIRALPESIQSTVDHPLELEYNTTAKESSNAMAATFGGAYPYWPAKCTLRGWLTYCADIHSLPEREDLRALSQFCSPQHDRYQAQRDMLFNLSETEESALYADFVLRNKRGWGEVLYDFDSLRDPGSLLTVEALLTLLPPIRPRDFSIASSPSQEILARKKSQLEATVDQDSFLVELCVAVVEGKTPLGRKYHGLCSHYMARLQAKQSLVRLWIRPGSFQGLPLEKFEGSTNGEKRKKWFANPLLCIGAGTGVAPLRALVLEREAVRELEQIENSSDSFMADREDASIDQYDNILVFGCRKEEVDYYYQKEWEHWHQSGRLFNLPAFSRADPTRKVYVQQKVKTHGETLMKYIVENDGAIYIAGNPSMARYTKEELVEATAGLLGEGGDKKANLLFKKLQVRGRFSVEAWS